MMDSVYLLDVGLDRGASAQDQIPYQQLTAAAPLLIPYRVDQKERSGRCSALEACDETVVVNLLSREQTKHPGAQVDASTVGPVVAGFAMFMFVSRLQSRHRYVSPDPSRK